MRVIAILSIFIIYAESSSRYFIYTFTNPYDPAKVVPYPLDICVNYDISKSGWLGIKVNYNYAKYTCNPSNDQVIMTKYDTDSACSSSGTVEHTYTLNDFNKSGDLHSFNCVGEDNYAEINLYEGDNSCCGSYTVSNMATNVCHMNYNGIFSMAIYDNNNATISSYTYSVNGCNVMEQSDEPDTTAYDNQCTKYKSASPVQMYVRMNKYFENGQTIHTSAFCVTTTPYPTLVTTEPSNRPTLSPTPTYAPTETPTTAPTTQMERKLIGNISVMNSMIIGGIIIGLVMVGIAMYCFLKRKKIKQYNKQNEVGLMNASYDYEVEEENQHQQPIALDTVTYEPNESNNQPDLPDLPNLPHEFNESDDDQVIIGTANEISIIR